MAKKMKTKAKKTVDFVKKRRRLPAKKSAKKAGSKKAVARTSRVPSTTIAWAGTGPLNHVLAENTGLAFPRYACTRAPHGSCIQFEYNNASGQYDLNPQPIDCSHCTHIIEPTG